MIGAGFHRGMDHPAAGTVAVVILHRGEPLARYAGIGGHVRQDQRGMLHNVLDLAQVNPHAENAARAAAITKMAALQWFRIQHTRIDTVQYGVLEGFHERIVPSEGGAEGAAEVTERELR